MYEFRFECQRCGSCCEKPGLMTDTDFDILVYNLGIDREEFYKQYCEMFENLLGLRPKTNEETGYCRFFRFNEDEGECTIHEIKLSTCRQQPVKLNPTNPNKFLIDRCYGYGKGDKIDLDQHAKETGIEETLDFLNRYALKAMEMCQKEPAMIHEFISFIEAPESQRKPSDNLRLFFNRVAKSFYRIG